MSLTDVLLGRPLASYEDKEQRIGPTVGVPVFGLDALSSAAYGPEAALTVLLPLGVAGVAYVVPITGSILILLAIVYLSYRQTIAAYPSGGGSYTVAKENLGKSAGLFAAAALMTDYVLNVAVGISAGVGALVSAIPSLQPRTLLLCLIILALLALVNLRGVKEAGFVFLLPTYLFVACLFAAIAWGVLRTFQSGGHPAPVVNPPHAKAAAHAVGTWLLLKAFASGCTAMTGVEAVSNGVQAFREPVVNVARRTLTLIIAILAILLAGIAYLVHAFGIAATEPGASGYQSILSMMLGAVAGRGVFYFVGIGAILAVLCLSANTSFTGFPLLCKVVASDGFLPHSFSNRGRRLVYSEGIVVLTVLSGVLLAVFGGVTDRLIPLFAVGAFLAFTLSQAGMVAHWRKTGERSHLPALFINALGAFSTAATIVIVLAAKFTEGAWVIALLVPALVAVMTSVRRHYKRVELETEAAQAFEIGNLEAPIAVLPVERWSKITEHALRFAMTISPDLQAVHVNCGEDTDALCEKWEDIVRKPAREAGRPEPKLIVVDSPYRYILSPILEHLLKLERESPHRSIAVVLPDLVERHWYHYFLHNQRAKVLSALLLLKGERRIVIVNVPWYLNA